MLESKNPHNRRKFARRCTGARERAKGARGRARRANAVLKGTTRATAGEWANGLGYFLNFHHLKPEAFSGFLR